MNKRITLERVPQEETVKRICKGCIFYKGGECTVRDTLGIFSCTDGLKEYIWKRVKTIKK
jgi:hypothetical protein